MTTRADDVLCVLEVVRQEMEPKKCAIRDKVERVLSALIDGSLSVDELIDAVKLRH